MFTSFASNSAGYSPPIPTPKVSLPPEAISIVPANFAKSVG